jgi:predicted GNAT family acetyltransferase
MIRPLTDRDRATAYALLNREPALTLYMLGNMETLGFSQDFCQFWGEWDGADGGGGLRAVLNRYMNGWTVYGLPDADWPGLARIMDECSQPAARLQDNPGGVASFTPFLKRYRPGQVHVETLMRLNAADFRPRPSPAGATVRRATLDDLPALVALYADAGDMSRSPAAVARPLRHTRIMVAETGGEIVSTALTNAETDALAMIGGVFTPPGSRGRGLSQAVCSALCADLLADGKQPVLYWKHPAAGAIYRKLGFHTVGEWRSVWLEEIGG